MKEMKPDINKIQSEIIRIETIPTIPDTFKKILSVLENPKASLSEIGKFILNDPVLTSRVLKMVNSPVYGFPGRIISINQALLLLGLNVVRGLLLGVSVFEAMQKSMKGLWEHSIGNAITSRIVAEKLNLKDTEEISIAGLLHDIGKVILILKFPEQYQEVFNKVEKEELFIYEAEERVFGITHADAGAWIAKKWNFPANLVEVIQYHHNPILAKNNSFFTSIITFSDILIRAKGIGNAGDSFVPNLEAIIWEKFNLGEKDLLEIFKKMEDLIYETEGLFI
ncbi:MAG: HDOD domain-containing protein [Thermodesulfovibrionales bacterium]|nr:HDOD domain-containing protein [Thermodesulfovibrionales bacterium]